MTRLELPEEIQLLMLEMHVAAHDRIREEAARDPARHKLTTVFPLKSDGGHCRYRFYRSKAAPRMREVRFCYSTGRNAAGYFLTWRERHLGDGTWQRDQWRARKARKAAKGLARSRWAQLEHQRGRA